MKQDNQVPTLELVPEGVASDGPLASKLCAAYGITPDPWQSYVLDRWLRTKADGSYSAGTVTLNVPRQNGKNATLVMYELFALAVQGREILHTAHQVRTAREAFRDLADMFSNKQHPELNDLVAHIRYANGQEAIELKNGGRVSFIARSRQAGLGFTADTVVCDEAQDLEAEHMEVLSPTLTSSHSGKPLMILIGTPPRPTTKGTIWRDMRRTVVSENPPTNLTWLEWGVTDTKGVDDPNVWERVNPGYGIRISPSFFEEEHSRLAADSFAREHLGWWQQEVRTFQPLFQIAEWERCRVDEPLHDDKEQVCYGIKYAIDGQTCALCAAAKQPSGAVFVDCIMIVSTNGRDLAKLAKWVYDRRGRVCEVVVDGKAGAAALAQRLMTMGMRKQQVRIATTHEVVQSCANFKSMMEENTLKHAGQPALTDSVLDVQRRDIGKMGDWGFTSGIHDCTPAEAAALAVWCACVTKRKAAGTCKVV